MLVSRILSLPGRINKTLDEVAQATADDDDNLLFGAPSTPMAAEEQDKQDKPGQHPKIQAGLIFL